MTTTPKQEIDELRRKILTTQPGVPDNSPTPDEISEGTRLARKRRLADDTGRKKSVRTPKHPMRCRSCQLRFDGEHRDTQFHLCEHLRTHPECRESYASMHRPNGCRLMALINGHYILLDSIHRFGNETKRWRIFGCTLEGERVKLATVYGAALATETAAAMRDGTR